MTNRSEPWLLLTNALRHSRAGRGHEDSVQEAVLRVWLRLGEQAAFGDCLRLGRKILRDLVVDARRRQAFRQLGHDDGAVLASEQGAPIDVWTGVVADVALRTRLGRPAVRLIEQLLAGVRRNKVLAARMHTSPAAIRRRRGRIARILAEHMRDEQLTVAPTGE